MKFFGTRYFTAAYEEAEPVETPVGALCGRCQEPISAGDDGWVIPLFSVGEPPSDLPYHRACFLRSITGSVAHQMRRCSCFVPGSTCADDPTLSKRQAAEAAVALYEEGAP